MVPWIKLSWKACPALYVHTVVTKATPSIFAKIVHVPWNGPASKLMGGTTAVLPVDMDILQLHTNWHLFLTLETSVEYTSTALGHVTRVEASHDVAPLPFSCTSNTILAVPAIGPCPRGPQPMLCCSILPAVFHFATVLLCQHYCPSQCWQECKQTSITVEPLYKRHAPGSNCLLL